MAKGPIGEAREIDEVGDLLDVERQFILKNPAEVTIVGVAASG